MPYGGRPFPSSCMLEIQSFDVASYLRHLRKSVPDADADRETLPAARPRRCRSAPTSCGARRALGRGSPPEKQSAAAPPLGPKGGGFGPEATVGHVGGVAAARARNLVRELTLTASPSSRGSRRAWFNKK